MILPCHFKLCTAVISELLTKTSCTVWNLEANCVVHCYEMCNHVSVNKSLLNIITVYLHTSVHVCAIMQVQNSDVRVSMPKLVVHVAV